MSSVIDQAEARARRAQIAVFIALVLVALAFALLADGPWHWQGTPTRILLALAGVAVFAVLSKLASRERRQQVEESAAAVCVPAACTSDDPLPVFYASQTGTAEMLACQTADALSRAGQPARAMSLEELELATLERLPRALFIASTTDEGDPPYPVAGFVRRVMDRGATLGGLRYGLLALGDSYYDEFCGFGRRLDAWLRDQGAQALFARIDVDDNDPVALAAWQARVTSLVATPPVNAWERPPFQKWRLARRMELNPGSLGEPVYRVDLVPQDGALPSWHAGDIAEIRPRHAPATVERWLAASGLDPDTVLPTDDGSRESLRQRLARSELPDPATCVGKGAADLATALVVLRGRDYSIASRPSDGHIELLIRQGRREDGGISLGADWLTRIATDTACIDLRLRPNPNFRAPDTAAPLILIGNGTGLAGLRALLRERIAHGRLRNWLVFGERQRRHDFYYREELEAAFAKGQLAHLDLAFSRDGEPRIYVQHRLAEQAERLREWVDAGATICVCGSQKGMGTEVDAGLRRILGDARMQELTEAGRYRRDVY